MSKSIRKEKAQFYGWVALAYFVLFLIDIAMHNPETFVSRAVNTLWRLPYIVLINYIFLEYVLPYAKLAWRRMLVFVILLAAQIFLCSAGLYLWRMIGVRLHIHEPYIEYESLPHGIGVQAGVGIFSLFFFGIIKHVYEFQKLRRQARDLRIQKQEAELNYLKSQTNPHFLFNTLNNIYSLARDKSDVAPESILRLSKLLRFMLYEAGGDYIAIEQEIKMIDDYISLEKLRYDESLSIAFNSDIENPKQALPPLLLIPLVENAFKHGVSETRNLPFVDIHLSVKGQNLVFLVRNSIESTGEQQTIKENIGLSNLRRQLELLYRDYSLTIDQDGSVFSTALKINLASHV